MNRPDERRRWLDSPRNVDRLVHLLWAACAALVVAEFLYHKHPHFGFDGWVGFHAAFGFLAYCAIVLSAKGLRRLIRRDEDYYGEGDSEDPGHG